MAAVSLKVMAESKDNNPGVSKITTFACDPRIIEIEPDFNARPLDLAHVASIREAYANGATLPLMEVRVEEGRIIIVDGHHRLAAIMDLIAKGMDIQRVEVRQFRGNDADRVVLMITSQAGLPLTPLQLGIQYRKMIGFGFKNAEIARKVGKSVQHIADMVKLAEANSDVQGMVNRGEVAAHVALAEVKKHGSAAGKVLAGHLETAKASGKSKVTKKQSKGMSLVAAIKREIESAGAEMAEKLCPEHADLITYLRSTGAA